MAVTVNSGQWTLISDCGLWIVGTGLSVMWHHGGVQTRGSAETHPVQYRLELLQVNQKTGPLKMVWVVSLLRIHTFTLATLLPGRTGAGGVGLVATSPRPTPTSTSPSPSCSGLPRWGPGSGQTCWSELVLANIQLLFDARWCSNVTKIIPNFTRGLVPPPRTGALKTSSSKFKVWSFSLKTY